MCNKKVMIVTGRFLNTFGSGYDFLTRIVVVDLK